MSLIQPNGLGKTPPAVILTFPPPATHRARAAALCKHVTYAAMADRPCAVVDLEAMMGMAIDLNPAEVASALRSNQDVVDEVAQFATRLAQAQATIINVAEQAMAARESVALDSEPGNHGTLESILLVLSGTASEVRA